MAEPTHTASTEAAGGANTFPPFNTHNFPSQLVWLFVTFVLLYALMAKWALPQVGRVIENRQKRLAADFAEAEQLKEQSEAALAAYEHALAEARARAQAIANERRDRQAAEAETATKAIEDQLAVKLAEAEKTIAATKETAMGHVRDIAEDTTRAIVERLIHTAPSETAVAEAVAEALKR